MTSQAITKGIQVTVQSLYKPEYSDEKRSFYVFAYRIRIRNKGEDAVQLMRRHWFIQDSIGTQREVEGEGVIGKQPVIRPGKWHEYESACDLQSDLGRMEGYYEMVNLVSGETFRVAIPTFEMVIPHKLN